MGKWCLRRPRASPSSYEATSTRDALGRPDGRLTTVAKNGVTVSTFTYDANGNRLRHNSTAGTYDAHDRLLQYGTTVYTYTTNGELRTQTDTTTGQTTTYTSDVLGNLRTVTLSTGTTIT